MTNTLSKEKITDYQSWERATRKDLPGRYAIGSDGIPIFSLKLNDVPVLSPEYEYLSGNGGLEIRYSRGEQTSVKTIYGLSAIEADFIFRKVDGKTSFAEIFESMAIRFRAEYLRKLFQQLVGTLILLPGAVSQLEQRIGHFEIVRFPIQSPYFILRSYWGNAVDVREGVSFLFESLDRLQDFKAVLSRLHILATMGKKLDSYYGGSGGIPTIPGGYRNYTVRTGVSAARLSFIQHQLQDFDISTPHHVDRLSRNMLRVSEIKNNGATCYHLHSDQGYQDLVLDELRETLVTAKSALEKNDSPDISSSIAYFHWLFIHAHPFFNINNSVAMNIVNAYLVRAQGRYLPHLLLDLVALRTEPEEYTTIFSDALNKYGLYKEDNADNSAAMALIMEYQSALHAEEMRIKRA